MTQRYSVSELHRFAENLLQAAGLPAEAAEVVARGLVEADLFGHNTHGLALLAGYVEELESGAMTRDGRPDVCKDFGAISRWDARRLPGIWTTALAIDEAANRAQQFGIGAIALANSHHIGCLAVFLEKPAREDIAVLVFSSDPSEATVAPFGGSTPALTPNPIAIGIPAQPDPILIDISMSITTSGMSARKRKEGARFPHQWFISKDGQPSDDPNEVTSGGAILPVGGLDHGHKGFALGLMVETLTQGLSGYGRAQSPTEWGAAVLVIAISTEVFDDHQSYFEQVNTIMSACRASTPIPDMGGVRMPGENALKRKQDALANGVALYPGIVESLTTLAQRFSIEPPQSLP